MRRRPIWLQRHAVIAAHQMLLAEFGGAPGLRDEGLLDSALARPMHLHAYEEPDLAALAAAYTTGIVQNHPFVDGNKRTGFMAAYVFLDRNGCDLTAPETEATAIMLALAAGEITEGAFATWLRAHTGKRGRSRARRHPA